MYVCPRPCLRVALRHGRELLLSATIYMRKTCLLNHLSLSIYIYIYLVVCISRPLSLYIYLSLYISSLTYTSKYLPSSLSLPLSPTLSTLNLKVSLVFCASSLFLSHRSVIADRCALFTEIEVLQKEVGAADAERAELQDRFVSAELDTLKAQISLSLSLSLSLSMYIYIYMYVYMYVCIYI